MSDGDDNVVDLGRSPPPQPPPRRPGRVHGLAITGMALSALIGIAAMLAFISVGWPGNIARYLIAVLVMSAVGFLLFASMAVFAAARDTYAKPHRRHDSGPR